MMNFLFNKKRPQADLKTKRDNFLKLFLYDINHQWVLENKNLTRGMVMLIHSMKEEHLDFFLKKQTYLIPCQAHLSCAIGRTKNHHLILVFPELMQILNSASFLHGIAIIAHELGHIYYQHTEKKVETLQAQIEADHFALELGLGEELQEILLDYVQSQDCRIRISELNKKLIKVNKK